MIDKKIINWYINILNHCDSPCIDCKEFNHSLDKVKCNLSEFYIPIIFDENSVHRIDVLDRIYYVLELKLHHFVRISRKCDFHTNMANRHIKFHSHENILKFLPIIRIGILI